MMSEKALLLEDLDSYREFLGEMEAASVQGMLEKFFGREMDGRAVEMCKEKRTES